MSLELIIGAVLPPLIDLINKRISSSSVKYVVSLVICLLVGVAFNYSNISLVDILGSGALIFGSAQTTYRLYWMDSGIRTKLIK